MNGSTIQPGKICYRCKSCKDRTEFSQNIHNKDGLQDWCKPCSNAYARSKREAKKAQPCTSTATP